MAGGEGPNPGKEAHTPVIVGDAVQLDRAACSLPGEPSVREARTVNPRLPFAPQKHERDVVRALASIDERIHVLEHAAADVGDVGGSVE